MCICVCELPLNTRTCRGASSCCSASFRSVPLKPDSPRLEKRLVPACHFTSLFILAHNIKIVPHTHRFSDNYARAFFIRTIGGLTKPRPRQGLACMMCSRAAALCLYSPVVSLRRSSGTITGGAIPPSPLSAGLSS